MDDFWDDSDEFTGPPLTDDMVHRLRHSSGNKLPASYLRLLAVRNGGTPRRCCLPRPDTDSFSDGHIALSGLVGIGGQWGIDAESLGSRDMIQEWGYPDVWCLSAFRRPRPVTRP